MKARLTYFLRLLTFGVVVLFSVFFVLVYVVYPPPALPRSQTRLIEWGQSTPFLQEMPEYTDIAQSFPFDGVIFDIASANTAGLSWRLFTDTPVDKDLLESVALEFKDFEWGRLTDNFLRLNINPGKIDWFDDYTAVLDNVEALAALAHDLEFAGIMFDTEQYPSITIELFNYEALPKRDQYDLDAYTEQAYQRGQDVMQAMNRGYPGITVMFTFGPSFVAHAQNPHQKYDLLLPFIEGMIAAADEDTLLVDGFEESYIYREDQQFLTAYKRIRATSQLYVRDAGQYADHVRAAFGLWIDPNCGDGGLPLNGCGFTLEEFEDSITHGLRYADRYIWIYSEHIELVRERRYPASVDGDDGRLQSVEDWRNRITLQEICF